MGTKVQSKSHFPEYFSMRDLNDEASGVRWPLYYEDKTLKSGHYYNSSVPRPASDGYPEFDKEIMKQTMLKHEAVFRNQVSELHRLYRIQRDLMEELKGKEPYKSPMSLEASQSKLFLSQMPSEDSQRTWHAPSIPLVNSPCSRPSISITENMHSPLKLISGGMQSDTCPTQNGGSFKDCEVLESKFIKLPKRTFDLQLPANEYIDSEEEEWIKEEKDPLNRNCGVVPESDMKQFLGSEGNHGCRGDSSKSNSCLLNKHGLADLNEPILVEEATSSAPVKIHMGFLGLPEEFFQNTQKSSDNGAHISVQNEGSKREWSSYNLEAGQSRTNLNIFPQGLYSEKSPSLSKPKQAALDKPCELPTFLQADHTMREPWSKSAICGIEISKRSQSLHNYNFLGPIEVPCIPTPYPVVPLDQFSSNLKLNSSFGSEVSYQNGFCHGPQSDPKASLFHFPPVGFSYLNCSNDKTSASEHSEIFGPTKYFKGPDCINVKLAKDINLNLALPNGFQRDLVMIDGEERNEDPLRSLPWLRTKPACNDGHTKERDGLAPCFIQDSLTASCSHDAEDKTIELGKCPSNKRIFGFPLFEEPDISKNRSSLTSPSKLLQSSESEVIQNGEVGALNVDLSHKEISGFRNHINLNSCAEDDEAPSTWTIQRDTIKIVPKIDLEAPTVLETMDDIPCVGESTGNQLEMSVQPSLIDLPDTSGELVRIAAEAIVDISSSDVHNQSEDGTCHRCESLHWLAEVVSSCMGDFDDPKEEVDLRGKISGEESSPDEIDYFESMTLKLTETKVDEYTKPWAPENQSEEEMGDSRWPTQRRKGQKRGRGRQRRDFQRDILPGLGSLSRHEVMEDLQTFGGMMKAKGQPWQIRLARSAARNGWARGRRPSRDPEPIVPAITMCLPSRQEPNNIELGLEEGSLKGWGRRIRRQRCQRYAVGNPSIPLTQV